MSPEDIGGEVSWRVRGTVLHDRSHPARGETGGCIGRAERADARTELQRRDRGEAALITRGFGGRARALERPRRQLPAVEGADDRNGSGPGAPPRPALERLPFEILHE